MMTNTRHECFVMVKYWLQDVRHCASLVVAARNRHDKTEARLCFLKALTNALEWREKARALLLM